MLNKSIKIFISLWCICLFSVFCPCFAAIDNHSAVYYWNAGNNFGDQLNKDLLNYFNLNYKLVEKNTAENIFIGSILGHGYCKKINTFGVGFLHTPPNHYKFPEGINCYGLRGAKSTYYVEKITGKNLDNCLLGDPGLLCREIFPMNEEKIYDVGIICHLGDKNSPYLKNIDLNNKSYTYININGPTKEVCRKINRCKFILASAMHALIAADSYGIPNRRIILADSNESWLTRCNFKFDDYYSFYSDINIPKPIDLKYNKICDEDIDTFTSEYNIPQNKIKEFCKKYKSMIKNHFENLYPIQDGKYYIFSKTKDSMALDVEGAGKDDKTNVRLYQFNRSSAQKFLVKSIGNGYYTISAECSGKALDVESASKENGTNVWQYSPNGTNAQQWVIKRTPDGYFNIMSKCNDLYLGTESNGKFNRYDIRVYKGNNSDSQKFLLKKVGKIHTRP